MQFVNGFLADAAERKGAAIIYLDKCQTERIGSTVAAANQMAKR